MKKPVRLYKMGRGLKFHKAEEVEGLFYSVQTIEFSLNSLTLYCHVMFKIQRTVVWAQPIEDLADKPHSGN